MYLMDNAMSLGSGRTILEAWLDSSAGPKIHLPQEIMGRFVMGPC